MKKLILLLFIPLVFACSDDGDELSDMQLTIVNNHSGWTINGVQLQGYSFDSFEIEPNGGGAPAQRTFTLYNGIPSGSSDVGVTISFDCFSWNQTSRVVVADFVDGRNTTITINEDRTGLEDWQLTCAWTHTTEIVNN